MYDPCNLRFKTLQEEFESMGLDPDEAIAAIKAIGMRENPVVRPNDPRVPLMEREEREAWQDAFVRAVITEKRYTRMPRGAEKAKNRRKYRKIRSRERIRLRRYRKSAAGRRARRIAKRKLSRIKPRAGYRRHTSGMNRVGDLIERIHGVTAQTTQGKAPGTVEQYVMAMDKCEWICWELADRFDLCGESAVAIALDRVADAAHEVAEALISGASSIDVLEGRMQEIVSMVAEGMRLYDLDDGEALSESRGGLDDDSGAGSLNQAFVDAAYDTFSVPEEGREEHRRKLAELKGSKPESKVGAGKAARVASHTMTTGDLCSGIRKGREMGETSYKSGVDLVGRDVVVTEERPLRVLTSDREVPVGEYTIINQRRGYVTMAGDNGVFHVAISEFDLDEETFDDKAWKIVKEVRAKLGLKVGKIYSPRKMVPVMKEIASRTSDEHVAYLAFGYIFKGFDNDDFDRLWKKYGARKKEAVEGGTGLLGEDYDTLVTEFVANVKELISRNADWGPGGLSGARVVGLAEAKRPDEIVSIVEREFKRIHGVSYAEEIDRWWESSGSPASLWLHFEVGLSGKEGIYHVSANRMGRGWTFDEKPVKVKNALLKVLKRLGARSVRITDRPESRKEYSHDRRYYDRNTFRIEFIFDDVLREESLGDEAGSMSEEFRFDEAGETYAVIVGYKVSGGSKNWVYLVTQDKKEAEALYKKLSGRGGDCGFQMLVSVADPDKLPKVKQEVEVKKGDNFLKRFGGSIIQATGANLKCRYEDVELGEGDSPDMKKLHEIGKKAKKLSDYLFNTSNPDLEKARKQIIRMAKAALKLNNVFTRADKEKVKELAVGKFPETIGNPVLSAAARLARLAESIELDEGDSPDMKKLREIGKRAKKLSDYLFNTSNPDLEKARKQIIRMAKAALKLNNVLFGSDREQMKDLAAGKFPETIGNPVLSAAARLAKLAESIELDERQKGPASQGFDDEGLFRKGSFKISKQWIDMLKNIPEIGDKFEKGLFTRQVDHINRLDRDDLSKMFGVDNIPDAQDIIARNGRKAFQIWLRNVGKVDAKLGKGIREAPDIAPLWFYAIMVRVSGRDMANFVLRKYFVSEPEYAWMANATVKTEDVDVFGHSGIAEENLGESLFGRHGGELDEDVVGSVINAVRTLSKAVNDGDSRATIAAISGLILSVADLAASFGLLRNTIQDIKKAADKVGRYVKYGAITSEGWSIIKQAVNHIEREAKMVGKGKNKSKKLHHLTMMVYRLGDALEGVDQGLRHILDGPSSDIVNMADTVRHEDRRDWEDEIVVEDPVSGPKPRKSVAHLSKELLSLLDKLVDDGGDGDDEQDEARVPGGDVGEIGYGGPKVGKGARPTV